MYFYRHWDAAYGFIRKSISSPHAGAAKEGKGADIAKEEAGRLAYRYELKNCDDAETQAFQA